MRRIVLLTSAALLCVLPASAEAAPRATDFELRVPAAAPPAKAAAAASRPWTSPVLRPGRRFHVFGLRWAHAPAGLRAEVRVGRSGRPWRRWTEMSIADGDGRGSDPAWAGGADRVQLRLTRRVRGLRLHFVRVTGTSRSRRPVARAAASQPGIIPRSQWGADAECRPRDAPAMGTVQVAFVHHTVSANEYGPGDSAAMVLGICRFHRNGNGWDDIGYNFLVDKYGQVFEGRAGGIDQPVVGAQAQGWNAQSTGIANLGTYQDVPQTDPALDAMARLIAWKLPLHGVPVTGRVDLESAGGASNRYGAGQRHTFERISGHIDGNRTECPGAQLYAQLPRLRTMAEQQAPNVVAAAPVPDPAAPGTTLTLAASRLALAYPERAQLTGRLASADGEPLPDVPVKIQVLTHRGFKAVTQTSTGPDGGFAAELVTSRNRVVRAIVGRTVSNTVRLTVRPALLVAAPARRVLAGRRAVLRGSVHPRKARLVVVAARQVTPTRLRWTRTVRVRASAGRFRATVPLMRPGLYRLRVRSAADRRNVPAQADFYVRAVRRASAVGGVLAGR